MSEGFTFEVDLKPLEDAITYANYRLGRPRQLMQLIGATLESNIATRFTTKTDPDGNAWLPLAPSTLRQKKGRGSILERSRHGLSSLGYNAGPDFVEIGFGESYMGWHETGTQRMPRRSTLLGDFVNGRLGRDDEADVLHAIDEFVSGSLF